MSTVTVLKKRQLDCMEGAWFFVDREGEGGVNTAAGTPKERGGF